MRDDEFEAHIAEAFRDDAPFDVERGWRRLATTMTTRRPRPRSIGRRQVAAALALFVAGAALGRLTADEGTGPAQVEGGQAVQLSSHPALELERVGGEYLADVRRIVTGTSNDEVAAARATVMATLYGVADEVIGMKPDDSVAQAVLQLVAIDRAESLRPNGAVLVF